LPEDEGLAAFADRFLLHVFVDPVPDNRLEELLAGGWEVGQHRVTPIADLSSLDVLNQAVPQVDMEGVRLALAQAIRLLRQSNVHLSDRRIVKAQQLIAAAAVLAGRQTATRADLWPLLYVIPTAAGQLRARETLRELLADASHPLLHAVVEQVAQQPMARMPRLIESADLLLIDTNAVDANSRIEALLREIDANFDTTQMPDQLAERRQRLIAAVGKH